jgi:hypothetical protein
MDEFEKALDKHLHQRKRAAILSAARDLVRKEREAELKSLYAEIYSQLSDSDPEWRIRQMIDARVTD